MTTAHGRSVLASQVVRAVAAASASASGSAAPTSPAAWANPVSTDSRLRALTQIRTSTARTARSVCMNSAASCVLPVPPWAAGAASVSAPWVSTAVWPGNRPERRSAPVSERWKYGSASGGMMPDTRSPEGGIWGMLVAVLAPDHILRKAL